MFVIMLSISVAEFFVSRVGLVITGYSPKLYNELMYSFICELLSFSTDLYQVTTYDIVVECNFLKCSTKLFI